MDRGERERAICQNNLIISLKVVSR